MSGPLCRTIIYTKIWILKEFWSIFSNFVIKISQNKSPFLPPKRKISKYHQEPRSVSWIIFFLILKNLKWDSKVNPKIFFFLFLLAILLSPNYTKKMSKMYEDLSITGDKYTIMNFLKRKKKFKTDIKKYKFLFCVLIVLIYNWFVHVMQSDRNSSKIDAFQSLKLNYTLCLFFLFWSIQFPLPLTVVGGVCLPLKLYFLRLPFHCRPSAAPVRTWRHRQEAARQQHSYKKNIASK